MTHSFDLTKLGSSAFENLVNSLALKVLGNGATGFCPGADGGRDGYFHGEAPYPSEVEHWSGIWYLQSKFLAPHLSKDPQKWLFEQIKSELEKFENPKSERELPDNWIIATNIDPSGVPKTGCFDKVRQLLKENESTKNIKFDIWGGKKIIDFLILHPEISDYYKHFLTPGHVLTALYNQLDTSQFDYQQVVRYFVVTQFNDNLFTKLEQAGSSSDLRPQVHDLFVDLPYKSADFSGHAILANLCNSAAECHRYSLRRNFPGSWYKWTNFPTRARTYLIKGGPGQGKSTIGQYLSQIHRSFLILDEGGPNVVDATKTNAQSLKERAVNDGLWPTSGRVPIQIELKEYAHWYSQRNSHNESINIISYISDLVTKKTGIPVSAKNIKEVISKSSWIVIFDGLDEVPNDSKDKIANAVIDFVNNLTIEIDADILSICTSRPQGYSGQFQALDCPVIELTKLDSSTAIKCAKPVLKFSRTDKEAEISIGILESAIASQSVQELMTTPLQSHIMAVVVRDGGRPPERRWNLFNSFYLTMKKRESQKNFANQRINKLLREEDRLLKSVHTRLGFILHARAEKSVGAQTVLEKDEFKVLVRELVSELVSEDIETTVNDVMEATTERLVLVSTPENGNQVRFDIRQLQEFFAAEFLYSGVSSAELSDRIEVISGDAHWVEVIHFILSALIENQRSADLAVSVQALRKLNEGNETINDHVYRRRIGKGVLVAQRLLSEGVLEQDLRDRQQIRPLLETIGCLFDLDCFEPLITLNLPRSRQWLINTILSEKIETSNLEENLGILFLLGFLLPNSHVNKEKVSNSFHQLSLAHQELLLQKWFDSTSTYDYEKDIDIVQKLSEWVVEIAYSILNSDRWLNYSPKVVLSLTRILAHDKEMLIKICLKEDFTVEFAEAIFNIFAQQGWNRKDKNQPENLYGRLSGALYEYNWINRTLPNFITELNQTEYLEKVQGLFKLTVTIIDFAKNRHLASLKTLIKLFEQASETRIANIPADFMAIIPVEGKFSLTPYGINHLKNINSEDELEAKISNLNIPLPFSNFEFMKFKNGDQAVDWTSLTFQMPKIVFLLFTFENHLTKEEKLNSLPIISKVIECFPKMLIGNFHFLGVLQELDINLLESCKAALRKITTHEIWEDSHIRFHHEISLPILKFPDDLSLLPIAAKVLVNYIDFVKTDIRIQILSDENKVEELSLDRLNSIANDNSMSYEIRSGALALYWIYLRDSDAQLDAKDLQSIKTIYNELRHRGKQAWLSVVLATCILQNFSENDEIAIELINEIFSSFISLENHHEHFCALLNRWRETSLAPVSNRHLIDKWINYKFTS